MQYDIDIDPKAAIPVPLRVALELGDADTILRYAESTVRYMVKRWFTKNPNVFFVRQMEWVDFAEDLRVVVITKVVSQGKFDHTGRYADKPERDLQRIFGAFLKGVLENHVRDEAKKYTRNPMRFLIAAPLNMDHIAPMVHNGDGEDPIRAFDLIASISTDGEEPVVESASYRLLLAKMMLTLSADAYEIARLRIEGYSTNGIRAETGFTAHKVRSLMQNEIQPIVADLMDLDVEVATN